jgi:ribonucleoside-diphosphate reductase beta chain
MEKKFEIGGKTFVLDEDKAIQAFQDKKVINGRESMTFNLLPLKYQWAYDLYRKMKANHWEPEIFPCRRTSSNGRIPSNCLIASDGLS